MMTKIKDNIPRLFYIVTLIATFFITIGIHFPGQISFDSIVQIYEGKSNSYISNQPPFMSFILNMCRVPWSDEPQLFLVLNCGIFFLSMILFIDEMKSDYYFRSIIVLLIGFFPVIFIYNGIIWKDVFFTNLCLAGFAFLYKSTKNNTRYNVIIAMLFFSMGSLARQQGFIVFITSICLLPLLFRKQHNIRLTGISLIVFVMIHTGFGIFIGLTSKQVSDAPVSGGIFQITTYDLVGIAANSNNADFRYIIDNNLCDLDGIYYKAKFYGADRIDWLNDKDEKRTNPFDKMATHQLVFAWIDAIYRNPLAYMTHRYNVFMWQIGFKNVCDCLPYYIGISQEPQSYLNKLIIRNEGTGSTGYLKQYGKFFINLFRPFIYVLLSIILLLKSFFDRQKNWLNITMQLSSIVYSFSYVVIGIACDFRYLYYTVPVSLFGIVLLFSDCGQPFFSGLDKPLKLNIFNII